MKELAMLDSLVRGIEAREIVTIKYNAFYIKKLDTIDEKRKLYNGQIELKTAVLDKHGEVIATLPEIDDYSPFRENSIQREFVTAVYGSQIKEDYTPTIYTEEQDIDILIQVEEAFHSAHINLQEVNPKKTIKEYNRRFYHAISQIEKRTGNYYMFPDSMKLPKDKMWLLFHTEEDRTVKICGESITLKNAKGEDAPIFLPCIFNGAWGPRRQYSKTIFTGKTLFVTYPDLGFEKGAINYYLENAGFYSIIPETIFTETNRLNRLNWYMIEKVFADSIFNR